MQFDIMRKWVWVVSSAFLISVFMFAGYVQKKHDQKMGKEERICKCSCNCP